jgi:dTDP-4-amino-4,6-dideoxygalactose transaminase
MNTVLRIGEERVIPILEDACQAHLAEWKGKKVGTLGDLGCFSFQASKNLNCGEGGAISSHNGELIAICASFHNAGRGYAIDKDGNLTGDRSSGFTYVRQGDNRRLTEFQGGLLLEQLSRLEEQTKIRETNANYLTQLMNQIPGISPASMYDDCTRNAYHLYMFRYDKRHFSGLSRDRFREALIAEGIPCSNGYGLLNKEPFIKDTIESRGFRNIYSNKYIQDWNERNSCPENDLLCEEAIWFGQTQLLGPQKDMDDIANAITKIHTYSKELSQMT